MVIGSRFPLILAGAIFDHGLLALLADLLPGDPHRAGEEDHLKLHALAEVFDGFFHLGAHELIAGAFHRERVVDDIDHALGHDF